MKHHALLVCALILLLLTGVTMARDLVPLPQNPRHNVSALDDLDDIFLYRMLDFDAEYYLGSGAMGDTFAVHFSPGFPVEINFAEFQFFSAGPVQLFIWDYSDEAEAMYPDGIAPLRGTSPVSPLGDVLWGPFNNFAEGTQTWEQLISSADLPGGALPIPSGDDFLVGFVKTTGELPQPLADDITARGTSYTWFGGPWMDTYDYPWGGYGSSSPVVDIMLRVDVTYTGGQPPIISGMTPLPDTPKPNKPCTVNAELTDDTGIQSAQLVLYRNDEPAPTVYPMSDPDMDDIWTADFTLNGHVGDTFLYYVRAMDTDGLVNDNAGQASSFDIVNVPNKPILFVDDGTTYSDQLQATLDDMGWQYAWWDVQLHGGVDKWVLAEDWDLVFVIGFGNSTVPTRDYGDDAYSDYLMAGGDMVFIDQDYFFTNAEPEDPIFFPGDFAYDFFGINDGINDPVPTDSQFMGEMGNPISGDWANTPFIIYPPDGYLWTDVFNPVAGATTLFTGVDLGGMNAHMYTNGYGGDVAVFGFDANFANLDNDMYMTDDWRLLMENLRGWFGVEFSPLCLDVIPMNTVIGMDGGGLFFDISLMNVDDMAYNNLVLSWYVVRPNGMVVSDLYSTMFDIPPHETLFWEGMNQCVPAFAPEGGYDLVVTVGDPALMMASDSFTFYKAAPPTSTASWSDEIWFGTDPMVSSSEANLPTEASLSSAWPNPFNPSTSFTLRLPESGEVQVQVFNVTGQLVKTLARGEMQAGTHTLTLEAESLSSGVYFVRALLPGKAPQTQKVMLVR